MNLKDRQQIVHRIWVEILQELLRAKELHPAWPDDVVYGAVIVAEEAGEVIRAALDAMSTGRRGGDLEKELIQTAAMSVRMLVHLRILAAEQ